MSSEGEAIRPDAMPATAADWNRAVLVSSFPEGPVPNSCCMAWLVPNCEAVMGACVTGDGEIDY